MQGNITGNKEGKVHQVRENKSLEEKGVRGGRREEESKCCFSKPLSLSPFRVTMMEKLILNQQLCPDHHHHSYIWVSFESVAIRYTSLLTCCYRLLLSSSTVTVSTVSFFLPEQPLKQLIVEAEEKNTILTWRERDKNCETLCHIQSSHKTIFHNHLSQLVSFLIRRRVS